MSKIAVLGAGITGLTLANILSKNGHMVTVFEKSPRLGGLCKTDMINGYVYDLHGGHVFNSKHNDVLNWVFGKIGTEHWHYSKRKASIDYNDRTITYPFELSLSELPTEEAIECILDFVKAKGDKPDNFHDWLVWNFGRSIADKYLIPYNAKIWQYSLEKMAIDWVDGKMPLPSNTELLRAALSRDSSERTMSHASFYYPLLGGIESLIQTINSDLPRFYLGHNLQSIVPQADSKFSIDNIQGFDQIFWTIPLPEILQIMEIPAEVSAAAAELRWNSITTFLFKSDQRSDASWKYFPNPRLPFHRIVYQGNLSPSASPCAGSSFTVEMIGKHEPEELMPYFPSADYLGCSFTDHAYVIFDKNHSKNSTLVKDFLHSKGIVPVGRFGEWQYYNMDTCIKRAFEVAADLIR